MKKIREILLFSLCVLLFSGSLTAAAADGAPIAENLEIMTYRGISVGGQLKAFDPEGSMRDGNMPQEIPPLDPALVRYFENGQKK